MRALVSDAHGSVMMANISEPIPTPSQLLIEVDAISINRGETFQLEAPPARWRPGKDFAGTILRPALDGSGPTEGTRVVGHAEHSAWGQRVAVGTDRVVPLPDSVTNEHAAALPLAGLTALRLARVARLSPGMSILMTGASGGVGHYFAELAARSAATLTAVVGSMDRGAVLRDLGATTLVDIAAADCGFDVGMDSIGGDSLGEVRRRTNPRGSVIWFGQASRTPATLNFFDWVDGTAAAPILQFDYSVSDRSLQRDLATLVELTAADYLHPVLDRVRHIDDARAAIDDLRRRRVMGNLIVKWS